MSVWEDRAMEEQRRIVAERDLRHAIARIAELEAALRAILALGHTFDPEGDADAMRGIARRALGGPEKVGPSMQLVKL